MSVLIFVATVLATSPTDAWIENSKAEFKLVDLSLEAYEKAIVLRVPALDSLSPETYDHLLASFFATLGQELISEKDTEVRVVDAHGNRWRHDNLDLSFLKPSKRGSSQTRQAYRTRYDAGLSRGFI